MRGFIGGLLNGIRESAPCNLCTDGIPDLLLLDVFRTVAHLKLDVVAFVIFHGIGVALNLLDCATERPPGRTWLPIMMAGLWRIALFRDVAGCFSRRLCGRVAGLLVLRVFGQRRGRRQRHNGHGAHQDRENLLVSLLHHVPPC